jgi:hypothetical protein
MKSNDAILYRNSNSVFQPVSIPIRGTVATPHCMLLYDRQLDFRVLYQWGTSSFRDSQATV